MLAIPNIQKREVKAGEDLEFTNYDFRFMNNYIGQDCQNVKTKLKISKLLSAKTKAA